MDMGEAPREETGVSNRLCVACVDDAAEGWMGTKREDRREAGGDGCERRKG